MGTWDLVNLCHGHFALVPYDAFAGAAFAFNVSADNTYVAAATTQSNKHKFMPWFTKTYLAWWKVILKDEYDQTFLHKIWCKYISSSPPIQS